ncbi:tRNA dihydrouridine synthase Dus2 [Schizosaccharomyces cryophilus OY26]|uniref:tRNA dihydrouridine synthase Dus2 n=1 Tax=Schizosaccharomyces cryophilus (strain OY26 / ATCC MYA-4695 / CBS 11777 / NBRC 106824 / NRRL Y48691) TaxID=653667 RepID=S9VTL8_SCHCR|nr:tRNA dihydrouridine synthase Dus2 [Schizosaccharomyces cryophilus OY26]EPY49390.1 tRNA dihydrouridine synthase Dus2 [Schizosaccharomyces cryophilus OY26]
MGLLNYSNKICLAPMVRIGELPTRLLALRYGANLVWGPEIVDKALVGGTPVQRVVNDRVNCIDFVKPPTNKVLFRVHPLEANRLVFQLGSASPDLAVESAKLVANDVAGIDLNCGCPKHFSVHAGMGAGLLKEPDRLISILQALVKEVGVPYNISISCKIRLLETKEKTLALIERLCSTGIRAITVHCRTAPMRNTEPAKRDYLHDIVNVCRKYGVSILANGDVSGHEDGKKLIEKYNLDGVLIARAAEKNVSCLRSEGPLSNHDLALDYLKMALEVENNFGNTKYCLTQIMQGAFRKDVRQAAQCAKSYDDLKKIFALEQKHSDASGTVSVSKHEKSILFAFENGSKLLKAFSTENAIKQLAAASFTKVIVYKSDNERSEEYQGYDEKYRSHGINLVIVSTDDLASKISQSDLIVCSKEKQSISFEALNAHKQILQFSAAEIESLCIPQQESSKDDESPNVQSHSIYDILFRKIQSSNTNKEVAT